MAVKIPENYVSGGFTMEYEVPWMTPGEVRKLDELVHSDDRVIAPVFCPALPGGTRR